MDPTPSDNFSRKLSLIHSRLHSIKERRQAHLSKFHSMRRVNVVCMCVINVLNTVSVTSIVMQFSGEAITLVLTAISSSLSALGTAILSVVDLEGKYHSHQSSYLQLTQLYDDTIARVLQDELDGAELDRILATINSHMGLILESSEPIQFV